MSEPSRVCRSEPLRALRSVARCSRERASCAAIAAAVAEGAAIAPELAATGAARGAGGYGASGAAATGGDAAGAGVAELLRINSTILSARGPRAS